VTRRVRFWVEMEVDVAAAMREMPPASDNDGVYASLHPVEDWMRARLRLHLKAAPAVARVDLVYIPELLT
jgi:hypothetical protein